MKSCVVLAIGLACAPMTTGAAMASDEPARPAVAISQIEQDIYDAVLDSWLEKEQGRQLVNESLSPPPSIGDREIGECSKGLGFPALGQDQQTSRSLAGAKFSRSGIKLIDGSQWRANDPGQGIANGKPVDAAVNEGISHSLISFSQIDFSRDKTKALVQFSMVCGSLCGSGSTLLLRRTNGHWAVSKRCGGWIS
jgi:hypothetical protein